MANALIAIGVVCGALAGVLAFDIGGEPFDRPGNDSHNGTGNGYAGVVGAQDAELREEYQSRSFESRLSQASSNESRAKIIAAETDRIESKLETLETTKAGFEEIDDDNRAQITSFVAQSRALERRFERVNRSAKTLPPALRSSNDLSEQRFSELRDRIESLTTPEMIELATDVAGSDVGDDLDGDDEDDTDDTDDADDTDDRDDADDRDDTNDANDADDTDDANDANDTDDTDDADDTGASPSTSND